MELLDVQHEKACLCQLPRVYTIAAYLLFLSFFSFSTWYRKQVSSQFTRNSLFYNIVTYFSSAQVLVINLARAFFKMVVMKCILEDVRSLLLRHSYFIHNMSAFILASLISLTVSDRRLDCLIKYQIIRWTLLTANAFFKIDFASKPNFSGKKSQEKHTINYKSINIGRDFGYNSCF